MMMMITTMTRMMTMTMTTMMTIIIAIMTMMVTVTCSLESMARQVRTATQRIERTPTCQFCHQAIVLSVLWSINNFCQFCHEDDDYEDKGGLM